MSSYVFPELATYKKTWVPLLEAAKEWIEDCKVVYVCNALDFVAREYEEGTEVAAKAAEVAKEIEDLIALAIKGYCKTVTEWPPASHHSGRAEQRAYRLAWIDYI